MDKNIATTYHAIIDAYVNHSIDDIYIVNGMVSVGDNTGIPAARWINDHGCNVILTAVLRWLETRDDTVAPDNELQMMFEALIMIREPLYGITHIDADRCADSQRHTCIAYRNEV